jgi:hypothetical protein
LELVFPVSILDVGSPDRFNCMIFNIFLLSQAGNPKFRWNERQIPRPDGRNLRTVLSTLLLGSVTEC